MMGTPRSFFVRSFQRGLISLLVFLLLFLVLSNSFLPVKPAQAAAQGSFAMQQKVPRFEPGACNFDVTTTLVEGRDLECGTLIVPEQYAKPDGPTIQLGVAIVKSHVSNPAPDPIVMLQGGPGGSTIDTYLQLIPTKPDLQKINRDIVLFDQRGTLYAKPSLFCQAYFDEGVRQLNEDISKEESNKRAQAALKQCHDQFVSQGVNLSAFNSFENAADVDALRQAMGWKQINLYGVSYGTLLALHVLRQYPQGLRSVILDSVVPPQKNFILDAPQSQNRALEAVFNGCAKDPACNRAYPDLKKVFYETVDRLNANKAHIQVMDSKTTKVYPALMDGDTFISAVEQMLYVTEWVPLIPRVIYNVHGGDYSFIEQVLSLVVFDRTLSIGMYFSVLCTEDADFQPQDAKLQGLPKEIADMEKDSAAQFLQTCSLWNVNPLPSSVDAPVSSAVPTLVLSGAFDPITPPAYAQEAASTLSNSYFFEFPVGGHGELTSGDCQDAIFLAFVNNPGQKPDGSCIASQKMKFSTPSDIVPLPKLISLLNLQGTSGIELILLAAGLLFLLTALIGYPIAWMIRQFRGHAAQPVPGSVDYGQQGIAAPAEGREVPRPVLYRLGPWLAGIAGLLLLIFIVALTFTAVKLALDNNSVLRLGLPASTRPLFLMPLVALILSALMVAAAVAAWLRSGGSAWGRLYFSLLTISAWVCIGVLYAWGMLMAFFAG